MSRRCSVRACALAVAVAAGGLPSCRAITTSLLNLSPQKTAAEAQARQFQASLEWQEVTPDKDVYMSITMKLGYGSPCNSGYMGAQFRSGGYNTLLWSMSGHEEGQVVPVSEYCHYDCFDCSPPNTRDFQCKRDDYELKTGVVYTFAMQMEMQNSTGAMWSVTMTDPTAADAGHPVEIGRVFFKDSESLENCRTLGLDVYAFQEYFNHKDLDFTTKAAWSATTLSGVMQPEDTQGYCDESTIGDFEGLSLLECKNKCAADETCRFASYSASDNSYAKVDGSHCMLYDTCGAKSTYLADIWWTYAKREEYPSITLTGFDSCSGSATCCKQYQDETSANTITEFAAVISSTTGEAEFEFQAGPDVQCPSAASLLEAAPLSEPASPALRGSAGDARGAPPQGGAPAPGEPVLFP